MEVVRRRRTVERRGTAPETLVERRRVHRLRIERVEHCVPHSKGRAVSVPNLGERVPAIGRFVQADRVCAGREPLRLTRQTDRMRHPADAECGRSVDVVCVRRVDKDLADAAPEEGVSTRRDTRVRSVAHAGVGELRPVVAAVRGLVDTDARLAAGAAAIGLAGTEVERVAARVVGISGQRADRVLRDPAREVCPARVRCESVVRPPNATAGGANPETAVTRHARRRDDENWTTGCGCIGLTGEREHAGLDSVLQGPVRLPVVVVPAGRHGRRSC